MSDFVRIPKAEYRRRMASGSRWLCTEHRIGHYVGTVRTVEKVQTNGYWFTLEGDQRRRWSPLSAVAEVRSDGSRLAVYGTGYDPDDGPQFVLTPA